MEETIVPKAFKWWCFIYFFWQCLNWISKKGKDPPPTGSVKTELGVSLLRCYLFSLTMFCKPSKANSTIPARHVGRQHSSQHRQRGSVPALGARFSEKRGSLGAQLFSESDPYLGASQEAEVFRNLAPSIGTGCFSKGESRAVKKKPRICLFSPEEKRQLIQSPCTVHSWTCTSRNACVRLHLLTQAGQGGQYLVRRHCCSERTADDSLLGHSTCHRTQKI